MLFPRGRGSVAGYIANSTEDIPELNDARNPLSSRHMRSRSLDFLRPAAVNERQMKAKTGGAGKLNQLAAFPF
jgi:hypothetical protein